MPDNAKFWSGPFGDDYITRNQSSDLVRNNEWLFRKALSPIFWANPCRILEFGPNIGMNILAMMRIAPLAKCEFAGVEVNAKACEALRKLGVETHETSMLDPARPWGEGYDLVLSKGVLIHLRPESLPQAYDAIHAASRKHIFIAEYFSQTPREIPYRGESGRLWARDFAGEMLDRFEDLKVVDYGFAWKRDPNAPQDDITWTLMSKGD